jgi:hypothetical protein
MGSIPVGATNSLIFMFDTILKPFIGVLVLLASITSMNAQIDSTSFTQDSLNINDTAIRKPFKLTKRDIQKVIKVIKASNEIRQIIKRDYSDLFQMNGFHPTLGYTYQGVNTLSVGLGYGKRHLFKPTIYENFHTNLLLYPSYDKTNWGFNMGYTQSKLFGFWGVETFVLSNGNGQANFAIRPEIGISIIGAIDIGYGFNLALDKNPSSLNSHCFVFRYTHQFLHKSIKNKVKEINHVFNRDYPRLKEIGLDILESRTK